MPKVSELWGTARASLRADELVSCRLDIGATCLIVGSGPSAGLCDLKEMERQYDYVIVLNQAWRLLPTFNMLLTIHPHETEVIPDSPEAFCERHGCIIATKRKGKTGWASELTWEAHRDVYVFGNNKDVHDFTNVREASNAVYTGRGIQATAMSVAAHMGFKQLYLVGCDMNSIGEEHHGVQNHHVRMHGLKPEEIYREYWECSFTVRELIRNNFGVQTYSINPFLGLGRNMEDYNRQLLLQDRSLRVESQPDTSAYTRKQDKFL